MKTNNIITENVKWEFVMRQEESSPFSENPNKMKYPSPFMIAIKSSFYDEIKNKEKIIYYIDKKGIFNDKEIIAKTRSFKFTLSEDEYKNISFDLGLSIGKELSQELLEEMNRVNASTVFLMEIYELRGLVRKDDGLGEYTEENKGFSIRYAIEDN